MASIPSPALTWDAQGALFGGALARHKAAATAPDNETPRATFRGLRGEIVREVNTRTAMQRAMDRLVRRIEQIRERRRLAKRTRD